MIRIRSSELSRLAAVTAAVAASTTEVIWELVRELERVLLVLRDEVLPCLELLVEERLALSSLITVEAREDVVVPLSVVPLSVAPVSVVPVSAVVEEPPPPSSLLQEMMMRLKRKIKIICRILFFITPPH
jgi:hypothetical protein